MLCYIIFKKVKTKKKIFELKIFRLLTSYNLY